MATVAIYGVALGGSFVEWDDAELITTNPLLAPASGSAVLQTWRRPFAGLYAPLTYTVYAAVVRLTGWPPDATAIHAVSLALHATGGVLVWLWLRRLCGRDGPAAVGALLWLLHPLQAEPVAWASGLNAVLGGVLGIASLWLASVGVTRCGATRWSTLTTSAFAAVLSLTAKPSGVLLPFMLLAVHTLILRRPWRETVLLSLAWVLLLLPFALIGRTTQATGMVEAAPPMTDRFPVAADAAGFYLLKVIWPVNLGIDYGRTPAAVLAGNAWATRAVLTAIVTAVSTAMFRRRPWFVAGWVVFLAGIGPVLGFVPFYFQSYSTVADRYAYLSLAGVALAVACGLRNAPRPAFVAAAAVLATFAALSFRQAAIWHDTPTLMRHAYAVNPDSVAANGHLGEMALRSGDLPFAETALRHVLDRRPYDAAVRAEYAGVLLRTGRAEPAAAEFARSLNDAPDNAKAFNGLGQALVATGHDADALPAFASAFRLDPTLADAPANAGQVLLRQGDRAAAIAAFRAALALQPKNPKALAGLAAAGPATRP